MNQTTGKETTGKETTGIEVADFPTEDYTRLVTYEGWRLAALAYCPNTSPERILTMQKHNETDEVFVLVKGNATLITAGNGEEPGELTFTKMEPLKAYNVKKGYWHNHILDEEGLVLIVENDNTCAENSPILPLTKTQVAELQRKVL